MDFDIKKNFNYDDYERALRNFSPNPSLVERVFKLYHELDIPEKDDVFSIPFGRDILWCAPFSPDLIKFEKIVSTLEQFRDAGQLDQIMDVLCFFVMHQKELYERMLHAREKAKTKGANREKQQKTVKKVLDLEEFLKEVEFKWHPISEEGNQDSSRTIRNPQTNASAAIKKVYRDNSEIIDAVLEKHGVKKDFLKEFSNCFRYYTDLYRRGNNGRTVSGYKLETRAPRSSDSRKKSSDAAKRSWKNRKK